MLWPYLRIWEWEWIFGRAVKAIFSLGVRSPCSLPWHHAQLTFKRTLARWYTQWSGNLIKPISSFWSKFCKMSRWQWNYSWIPIAIPSGTGLKDWQSSYPRIWMQLQNGFQPHMIVRSNITELWMLWMVHTYYVLHKVLHVTI